MVMYVVIRTYEHGVAGTRSFGNGVGARFAITHWVSHSVLHTVLVGGLYDIFRVVLGLVVFAKHLVLEHLLGAYFCLAQIEMRVSFSAKKRGLDYFNDFMSFVQQ